MNSSDQVTPSDDSSLKQDSMGTPEGSGHQTAKPQNSTESPEKSAVHGHSAFFVPWPPPGLEKIQGTSWPVIRSLGLGGAIVVLPLLWVVVTKQQFWKLGPLGEHGWIVTLSSSFGHVILLSAFSRILKIAHEGFLGVKRGHGWMTVFQVITDDRKDTGFLILGARIYTTLSSTDREKLMRGRLFGALFFLAAMLWITFGFVVSVFLAARGLFGSGAVIGFTIVPTAILMVIAIYCRVKSYLLYLTARRRSSAEVQEEVDSQVNEWVSQFDQIKTEGVFQRGSAGKEKKFRTVSMVTTITGLFFLMSILGFIFVNSVIPSQILSRIPAISGIETKVDRIDIYRRYRLPPNPETTAELAGQALHSLDFVGRTGEWYQTQQVPVRQYEQQWSFGRYRAPEIPPCLALLEMETADLTRDHWAALEREARNPAHQEFEITGHAVAADVFGTRWIVPFPDTLSWIDLPVPRLSFPEAARSHITKAAYELHRGQVEQAENTIREIISTGFLLVDEDIHLIGNLIGIMVVEAGGIALKSLYLKTGRMQEAEDIIMAQAEVEQALRPMTEAYDSQDIESDIRIIANTVLDESKLRGLRWELLPQITTFTPCMNLNKAVFGPGDDYLEWLESARESLVRRESDRVLFDLLQYGSFATRGGGGRTGMVELILGLMFGRSEVTGGCFVLYGINARTP